MYPRASLIADIVASVPELVIRTISAQPTISEISCAISSSPSQGIPYEVPFSRVAAIADFIVGWLCPKSAGPHEQTKSISSRPSQVVIFAPFAERTKNGSPPTPRNARTGEFTPPGISCLDFAKSSFEVIIIAALF